MFAVAAIMGERVGSRVRPRHPVRLRPVVGAALCFCCRSCRGPTPDRWLVGRCDRRRRSRLLVSSLNNYTLSPISDERVSEAASVNSAAGSFGLSFGLAFGGAVLLASLSLIFTKLSNSCRCWPAAEGGSRAGSRGGRAVPQQHGARRPAIRSEPEPIQDEIVRINIEGVRSPSARASRADPRRPSARSDRLVPDDEAPRSEAPPGPPRNAARLTPAATLARCSSLTSTPRRSRSSRGAVSRHRRTPRRADPSAPRPMSRVATASTGATRTPHGRLRRRSRRSRGRTVRVLRLRHRRRSRRARSRRAGRDRRGAPTVVHGHRRPALRRPCRGRPSDRPLRRHR